MAVCTFSGQYGLTEAMSRMVWTWKLTTQETATQRFSVLPCGLMKYFMSTL